MLKPNVAAEVKLVATEAVCVVVVIVPPLALKVTVAANTPPTKSNITAVNRNVFRNTGTKRPLIPDVIECGVELNLFITFLKNISTVTMPRIFENH